MKGRIEREFGVPIPGEILPPERWTKTALKKLPPEGPLDAAAIFGRKAPLIVDLGCGNGRFLLGNALARPECDHLGVDILPMVLRYATRRANQRGLGNVRWAAIDGQTLVAKYLAPASVLEFHCYHPQPFHDPGQAGRRLLAPAFLADLVRALEPKGKLFLQTDNRGYWNYLIQVVPAFFDFHEQGEPWPETPRGRTRREIMARRRGLPIRRGWGEARALDAEAAAALVRTLPPPDFDAGPGHRDLDALEMNHGS
jgi:tRNA (guanine-N7-)-methyltransferase